MSSLKTLRSDHPIRQHHIPEEWNSQLHHCENVKLADYRIYVFVWMFPFNRTAFKMQHEI